LEGVQISTTFKSVFVPFGLPFCGVGKKLPVWKYKINGRLVSVSPEGV
jgi:hypothetical protein